VAKKFLDSITDVSGIKVGHWTDRRNATGCTVVLCERGAMPGVDVRGGAPGTMETDLLKTGYTGREIHGVLLGGGSAFGLAAPSGVTRWLEEHGVGLAFGGRRIPIVPAAIIYDLGMGNGDVRPTVESGYAAAAAAKSGRVAEGSVGVGTGASVSGVVRRGVRVKGGVGTASEDLGDGLIIAALVAVNAVGSVYDSSTGAIIAGIRDESGAFIDPIEVLRTERMPPASGENTTIGVIATNARITKEQANRLAMLGHDGMARAIRPVHTLADGDALFAMATGEVELDPSRVMSLEAYASVVVERAIVKAVRAATSLAGVRAIRDL
jgi:L-aminopeptidase/D-esterase-like protein